MKRLTHLLGGALAGGAAFFLTHDAPNTLALVEVAAGAAFGSMIPDIDHPYSTASKKMPVTRLIYSVATIGSKNAKHRGFMHSLLLSLPWLLLAIFVPHEIARAVLSGVFVGYISHLLLDCLNPSGCPLFFPWKKQIRFGGWIRTGGWGEMIVTVILVISIGILCFLKVV